MTIVPTRKLPAPSVATTTGPSATQQDVGTPQRNPYRNPVQGSGGSLPVQGGIVSDP